MGKFQLNKKGEDPLKIYEDTFKIANDTVETHLDKLGRMPKPISESRASEGSKASIYDTKEDHNEDSAWNLHSWDIDTGNGMRCGVCGIFEMYNGYNRKPTGESKASEGRLSHYTDYFDQAYSDRNDENPITGYRQCDYCDSQFRNYDDKGMIDHANSRHNADLDPNTGETPNRTFPSWDLSRESSEWESVEAIASEGNTNHDSDGKFATGNTLVYTQGKGKLTSTVEDGDSDVLKQWIKDQEDNPEQADQIRAVKKLLKDRGE